MACTTTPSVPTPRNFAKVTCFYGSTFKVCNGCKDFFARSCKEHTSRCGPTPLTPTHAETCPALRDHHRMERCLVAGMQPALVGDRRASRAATAAARRCVFDNHTCVVCTNAPEVPDFVDFRSVLLPEFNNDFVVPSGTTGRLALDELHTREPTHTLEEPCWLIPQDSSCDDLNMGIGLSGDDVEFALLPEPLPYDV